MMRQTIRGCLLATVTGWGVLALAQTVSAGVTDADIDNSFFPYKAGFPAVAGVKPGTTLDKSNVDAAQAALPPTLYRVIKAGEYSIDVQAAIDFAAHPKFIEATKLNAPKVKIGPDGKLVDFDNGRPFPQEPSASDPQAGAKLAWNFQYGRVWGDLGCFEPWYWDFKNYQTGKTERTIVWDKICMTRIGHRGVDAPTPEMKPNPGGLYRAIYGRISDPVDIKGTQLLIHKFLDDGKQSDGWLYLGFQRRVRRLVTSQTTDAFLGSDIMLEDFEGFNGRISDFNWTFKETKPMLLPWYDRSAAKNLGSQYTYKEADGSEYKYTAWTGQGGCYPDAPWQLRKAYVVEQTPKDPSHPLSRRVFYIDAQTNEIGVVEIYDRKGELWKLFIIGWPHNDKGVHSINQGKGADLGDTAVVVDLQAKHCTTVSFRGRIDPSLADPSLFTIQNMRGED
jgi:hypothetical protein